MVKGREAQREEIISQGYLTSTWLCSNSNPDFLILCISKNMDLILQSETYIVGVTNSVWHLPDHYMLTFSSLTVRQPSQYTTVDPLPGYVR